MSESVPYASRQTDRAPPSRFMSFCVSQSVIIKSFFPVMMRKTSSAKGILSLKRQRIKSSSIGLNCSRRCKSFCCFVSANNSTFFLLSDLYETINYLIIILSQLPLIFNPIILTAVLRYTTEFSFVLIKALS